MFVTRGAHAASLNSGFLSDGDQPFLPRLSLPCPSSCPVLGTPVTRLLDRQKLSPGPPTPVCVWNPFYLCVFSCKQSLLVRLWVHSSVLGTVCSVLHPAPWSVIPDTVAFVSTVFLVFPLALSVTSRAYADHYSGADFRENLCRFRGSLCAPLCLCCPVRDGCGAHPVCSPSVPDVQYLEHSCHVRAVGFPIISEGKVRLALFLHLGWKQKSFQYLPECLSHVSPVTSACRSCDGPPGSVLPECEFFACRTHQLFLPLRSRGDFLLAP